MRSLSPEEAELWARVTATIRPLSRKPLATEASEDPVKIEQPNAPLRSSAPKPRPASPPTPKQLASTLEQAIDAGDRVILLITGHHRPGEPPVSRGKIRAAVYDWLAASRHAPRIAAVRGAHRRHGGGGSLYLILRRR